MASTFSPSLRLELIGDGDQSGIWGQTTNNNLGGLLEQAISGVVTITMLDANYTMSSFNGVVDEARNQVLVLTGTLSTQRNLVAPLVEKTYTIKNSTTGGFGVQIIGSSGTGVIIPNGTTASVYCDGTNFYPTTTGSTGNQTINGNLAVTGTTTLTGALSGSTAVFSGAISSVNPTFTGTPTAPTAIAGTNTTQIATTAFVQGVAGSLGTMSTQNANAVAITGGTMSGMTSIAGTTGSFSGAVSGATAAVGTNTTQLATTAFVQATIPAGVILLWAGSIASIPTGWYLCNGANGTPDLRDRFVVGAGTTYAVGATGGSATTTLIEANLPSHTHSISASGTTASANLDHTHSLSASGTTAATNVDHTHSGTTGTESANHTHGVAGYTGGQTADHSHGPGAGSSFIGNPNTGGSGRTDGAQATNFTNTGGTSNDHAHYFSATSGGISANHTHTVTTGGMSANTTHTHTVSVSGTSGAMSANASHTHTVTVTGTSGATGSGTAFSNLPPYYALAYIQKA